MRNEVISVFDDCNGSVIARVLYNEILDSIVSLEHVIPVIARVLYNEILAPFLGLTVIKNDDGQKSYILIKGAEIEGKKRVWYNYNSGNSI